MAKIKRVIAWTITVFCFWFMSLPQTWHGFDRKDDT